MKEKSENRKALPKFLLTLLIAGFIGGIVGGIIGISDVFGLNTASIAAKANQLIQTITPWAIPATSVVTMGSSFLLYRSAKKQFAAWDGENEDEASEGADSRLQWVLLLSCLQLLVGLFFFASASYYELTGILYHAAVFLVSMGFVLFAQQKVIDLTRQMNPEKKGSVYDMKFQEKWLGSCDEAERQQIGQAAFHAYALTSKVCLWMWLMLMLLNMMFGFGMMPVFVALVVWGVLQVSYTLECIRMSKKTDGPMWRC